MKVRTGYSFRQAAGSLGVVMDVLKDQEWPVAPLADRASTFGFCQWRKAAGKAGIRPIYGVELAVTDSRHAKKPATDYWTFLATDSLKPLNKLVETATNQFRFEPLLEYNQAMSAKGVVVVAGRRPLVEAIRSCAALGLPLPYAPIMPSVGRGALRAMLELGMPPVLACDNQYPRPEDRALYETICGRAASTQTWPQWILSLPELHKRAVKTVGQETADIAMANTLAAWDRCVAQLPQGALLNPKKPKTLRVMCEEGAAILGCDLTDPVYAERLDRELKLIAEKDFESYFYIIADAVQWARDKMLVGPARGSSCGSLVCYLLRITTIDPIPYGLIFERFIDVNRNDLPDIDIDFADEHRELFFKYMRDRYGSEHCARIGTSALYKPRSAIKEACAALRIPLWETEAVLDSIIVRSSGDSRAMNTIEDTFTTTKPGRDFIQKYPQVEIAMKMEGHPRHFGQHAAGIIVTDRPVAEYVAIDGRSRTAMCDKKDAEELNLLKIDALGLTQLSVLQDLLKMIGKPLNFFDTLPTDDPEAFAVLNRQHYAGIFQFNGLALKSVARQIKFEHLEDIIAVTALARPGPLASGGTHEWIKRKNGQSPIRYPHPLFEPYLRNSMGIVIYQEQVMEIGRNIGDLSWSDVTALRKAMSKSLGKEYFDQFGDRWKAGAIAKGVPASVLDKVWDDLCAYGAWSFNRSHSVAYGLISYWCCWAKAHHPYEFAAATLSHENKPEAKMQFLRELEGEGIGYVPFDIRISTDKWQVGELNGNKRLIGPVGGVVGIGPKGVEQFVNAKKQVALYPAKQQVEALKWHLPKSVAKVLYGEIKTDIDTIWPVRDAFARLLPDPRERNIYTTPTRICDIIPDGTLDQEHLVFVVIKKIAPRDENEAVNVAKRGYAIKGPHMKLNLRIADDTEEMLAMVGRRDYDTIGKEIIDRGGVDKALYAMKGTIMPDFKMMIVKRIKYIGDLK